jgi:hypothetical protein
MKRFYIFSSVFFLYSCKSIDKKIIGTWYDVVSNYDLLNNDSLYKLISANPEKLENYKYYPSTTYSIDGTFHSKYSDYKERGTFAFKGDTLMKMAFDTTYLITYRIDKNVYVTSDARYANKHYFYSVKKSKLDKFNQNKKKLKFRFP